MLGMKVVGAFFNALKKEVTCLRLYINTIELDIVQVQQSLSNMLRRPENRKSKLVRNLVKRPRFRNDFDLSNVFGRWNSEESK